MNKNEAIKALKDMKRQIEIEEWSIPANDRGSGSAGVSLIRDTDAINEYLYFAETGDNSNIPQCDSISYIPVSLFGELENEIVDEILDHVDFVERNEIVGLVVCDEHYDMDYTFYMAHIEG